MKLLDFNENFDYQLRDPEYARAFLEEALNYDFPRTFLVALRDVIRVNGGMTEASREADVNSFS
jgi:DNA-binding phage protein